MLLGVINPIDCHFEYDFFFTILTGNHVRVMSVRYGLPFFLIVQKNPLTRIGECTQVFTFFV